MFLQNVGIKLQIRTEPKPNTSNDMIIIAVRTSNLILNNLVAVLSSLLYVAFSPIKQQNTLSLIFLQYITER